MNNIRRHSCSVVYCFIHMALKKKIRVLEKSIEIPIIALAAGSLPGEK